MAGQLRPCKVRGYQNDNTNRSHFDILLKWLLLVLVRLSICIFSALLCLSAYTWMGCHLTFSSYTCHYVCTGPHGVPGFRGWKGDTGPAGDTGATGATGIQVQDIRRRFVRQVAGCPGGLLLWYTNKLKVSVENIHVQIWCHCLKGSKVDLVICALLLE